MNITTCLFTVLGGMATLGHPSETVRLNQLGYYPQQEKVAVVNAGEVREFTIVDAATGNRLLFPAGDNTLTDSNVQFLKDALKWPFLPEL